MMILRLVIAAVSLAAMNSLLADDLPASLKIGDRAPEFSLPNENGKLVSLSGYKGQNIVLVFSRAHW